MEENYVDTSKSKETFLFNVGLVALAENNWMYPYQYTLIKPESALGAYLEQVIGYSSRSVGSSK